MKLLLESFLGSAKEVCNVRKGGDRGRRKGSEWCNDEVKELIKRGKNRHTIGTFK